MPSSSYWIPSWYGTIRVVRMNTTNVNPSQSVLLSSCPRSLLPTWRFLVTAVRRLLRYRFKAPTERGTAPLDTPFVRGQYYGSVALFHLPFCPPPACLSGSVIALEKRNTVASGRWGFSRVVPPATAAITSHRVHRVRVWSDLVLSHSSRRRRYMYSSL